MFTAILRTSFNVISVDDEEGVVLHHQGAIVARLLATIAVTRQKFGSVNIEMDPEWDC